MSNKNLYAIYNLTKWQTLQTERPILYLQWLYYILSQWQDPFEIVFKKHSSYLVLDDCFRNVLIYHWSFLFLFFHFLYMLSSNFRAKKRKKEKTQRKTQRKKKQKTKTKQKQHKKQCSKPVLDKLRPTNHMSPTLLS